MKKKKKKKRRRRRRRRRKRNEEEQAMRKLRVPSTYCTINAPIESGPCCLLDRQKWIAGLAHRRVCHKLKPPDRGREDEQEACDVGGPHCPSGVVIGCGVESLPEHHAQEKPS